MSKFNEANDLAAQLCWGRTYMGDCPMKLDRIVLRKTNKVFREEVSSFDALSKNLIRHAPELLLDGDWGAANKGVTLVLLRNWPHG